MPASMYRNYFAKTFEKNSNLTEINKANADLKHTVRPKVCGHLITTFTYVLVEHIPEYSIFCLFVAVIITSALLRRLSARRRRGIRVHSATSVREIRHRCWARRTGVQSLFKRIPKGVHWG